MDTREQEKRVHELRVRVLEGLAMSHGFELKEWSSTSEELQCLSEAARGCAARRVGEIGFHLGLSSLAFLNTHPDVTVVSFDLVEYGYVTLAKQYIDRRFPGRHTLIPGDSKQTVPQFRTDHPGAYFDLIFIDGGHDLHTARTDIRNMSQFATGGTLLIMDDIAPWCEWGEGPATAWAEAVAEGLIIQEGLYVDGKLVVRMDSPGKRSWAVGRYSASA